MVAIDSSPCTAWAAPKKTAGSLGLPALGSLPLLQF